MHISAKEAKDRFGEVMETARTETVTITRHSRPAVAVISVKRLEELEAFEDRYWLELSRKGEESGSMGVEASEKYLRDILNAEA